MDAVRRAPEIALSDLDVSAELRARMRRHLIEQGRLDEAIASLRKAVDADPQNAAAYDHLGTRSWFSRQSSTKALDRSSREAQ